LPPAISQQLDELSLNAVRPTRRGNEAETAKKADGESRLSNERSYQPQEKFSAPGW
jgi:hypothetical protein